MTDRNAAGPGGRPAAKVVVPPCLAVVIGQADKGGPACRVDAPDRLLRIWALLASEADDLRQVSLRPALIARLCRQFDALVAELETSLSRRWRTNCTN